MSAEDEFSQYKQVYEDLQKRVERLSLYNHLYAEVRARIEDLAKQVDDFPGLEELNAELDALGGETALISLERACPLCGEGFLTHLDEMLCPKCRDD